MLVWQLTPFTAFTVEEFVKSSDPLSTPHRITLAVAPDNKQESEDLPISPWG